MKIQFKTLDGNANALAGAGGRVNTRTGRITNRTYSITFDPAKFNNVDAGTLAHEGQHIVDGKAAWDNVSFRRGRFYVPTQYDLTNIDLEDRGYEAAQLVYVANEVADPQGSESSNLYNPGWEKVDEKTFEANLQSARALALWKRLGYLRWPPDKSSPTASHNTYSDDFNRR